MRGLVFKVATSVFGLAALLIILEHAGGFSSILGTGSSAFATGYEALTGHGGGSKGVATGYNAGGKRYV